MEPSEIKKLSQKNFYFKDMVKAKRILEKDYEISYGQYTANELKKALSDKFPFYINNHFIIGFDSTDNQFWNDKKEKLSIDRMVKAIIIEDVKLNDMPEQSGDLFAIVNRNEWDEPISEFMSIIGTLRVGEIFIPPHSIVFNFLKPTEKQKKEKIVSLIESANINVYEKEDYIDNIIHEMGHLFWRDCMNIDEKQKFKEHFDFLKPSALYEYDWERSTEEEVFCTIYKWYIKSILLNPSFYNILEFEDPVGLKLLQNIFDRIAKDKLINDIWEFKKDDLNNYLNPRMEKATGRKIIKKGLFDEIKDIEIPENVINENIDRFENGIEYIKLNKAIVPIKGNKIDWGILNKNK